MEDALFAEFARLPQKYRPAQHEWTVLAAFVVELRDKSFVVASMGLGTKCIGASKMSEKGDVVNDSHAEVLSRRGFKVFLLDELRRGASSQIVEGNALRESVRIHLYISQSPCGDASIFPLDDAADPAGVSTEAYNASLKRKAAEELGRSKSNGGDSHGRVKRVCRPDNPTGSITGAKSIHNNREAAEAADEASKTGVLRVKPGRGDRTQSMCCSDKIAKWNAVGIQGALLSLFLPQPIFLSSIVIGNLFHRAAFSRALLRRTPSSSSAPVAITPATRIFEHTRENVALRSVQPPSAFGLGVCFVATRRAEVTAVVAAAGTPHQSTRMPAVCKASLCANAKELLASAGAGATRHGDEDDDGNHVKMLTYRQLKERAGDYRARVARLYATDFTGWLRADAQKYESFR